MCGIVGYVQTKSAPFENDMKYRKALRDLLFLDSLRGQDSTGVLVVPQYNPDNSFIIKRAVPGFIFVEEDYYNRVWNSQSTPGVYLGHNRAATRGDVTEENAHPFRADHIALVHNGTLNNFYMLESGTTSTVDSCHIAHAIAKHGADKVLSKLDGSAILVWYNFQEHSMNIARTTGRNLFWIFDKYDTCWFASEREMLWHVLVRNGIEVRSGAKPTFYQPEEFHHYRWNLKDTGGGLVRTKFEEYVPQWKKHQNNWNKKDNNLGEAQTTTPSTMNTSSGGGTNSESSKVIELKRHEPHSKRKIRLAEQQLRKYDLSVGDEIIVRRIKFSESVKSAALGDIEAVWPDKGVKVIIPDVPFSLFTRQRSGMYKVLVYNVVKQHVPREGRHEPVIFAKLKPIMMKDLVQGPYGTLIPRDEFERLAAPGCTYCTKPVTIDNHENTVWLSSGLPLCRVCSSTHERMERS